MDAGVPTNSTDSFAAEGGEMGELIRTYDWASTSIGPLESWPLSLRTCVQIMLRSRQPIWIGWGTELIKLYNDPYKEIVKGKHPWALGKPVSLVWRDIWKDIKPMLDKAMYRDEGTYVEEQLLIMERNGYPEETYYTFSYTPVAGDDGRTAGMICFNTDDTEKIINERQLRTLTQVGNALAELKAIDHVYERTIDVLKTNPYDFPFAMLYKSDGQALIRLASTDRLSDLPQLAEKMEWDSPEELAAIFKQASASRKPQLFDNLRGEVPKGAWEVSSGKAIIVPVTHGGNRDPYAFLLIGANPYRLPDDKYLAFFSLIADQIANSISNIEVIEQERLRIEALAEIDRAKTVFFSNVSHEFRTPLTLILGSLETLEAKADEALGPENKSTLAVMQRNGLRLLRLVNNLLDFSRIEAGRERPRLQRVDVSAFTRELASNFSSLIDNAGLDYEVDIESTNEFVLLDRSMWEKIVLNLISNAFKYTLKGSISLSLAPDNERVVLKVKDTGVGIPANELPKMFQRFHRVQNVTGRTYEGTGIGLSLVSELVKLHNGEISVTSEVGVGSEFTVSIPRKAGDAESVSLSDTDPGSDASLSDLFLEESSSLVGSTPSVHHYLPTVDNYTKKVLIVDDNPDMRSYIANILQRHYQVISATNGKDALEKIAREAPDLVISDIMMPVMDGVQLMKAIKEKRETQRLPVILLSARAGEEARIEGYEIGADDYLVKPFSAKELITRISSQIRLASVRQAVEKNLRDVILQTPVATVLLRGSSFVIEIVNEKALEVWGRTLGEVTDKPIAEALPEVAEQGFDQLLHQVFTTGIPFNGNEVPVELLRFGKPETIYLNYIYTPLRDENNIVTGVIGIGVDVTQQVMARKRVEESRQELIEMANAMPQLVWIVNERAEVMYFNNQLSQYSGVKKLENGLLSWDGLLHAEDLNATYHAWTQAVQHHRVLEIEHRLLMADGTYRWHLSRGVPQGNEPGKVIKWFGTSTDVHEQRSMAESLEKIVNERTRELQRSNHDLQQFAHVASHDLKEPLRKVKTFANRLEDEYTSCLPDKARGYLAKVQSAADRMANMVTGVLTYSLANAVQDDITSIDLNRILRNIESDLEVLIDQKRAAINRSPLPTIEGTDVLLYQLFYNLIYNSLKFSSADRAPVINITCEHIPRRQSVKIFIQDNGIGFEQEYAGRIFETFTRLNSKDKFDGTGLGLALCKKIVERHDGTIEARGALDHGATFTVTLPLQSNSHLVHGHRLFSRAANDGVAMKDMRSFGEAG